MLCGLATCGSGVDPEGPRPMHKMCVRHISDKKPSNITGFCSLAISHIDVNI